MNRQGPVLSMAPAVQADVPYHRSHSAPDLFAGLPHRPPTVRISSPSSADQQTPRTLGLKSLPTLPDSDAPSIDLDLDFDFQFDDHLQPSLRSDAKQADEPSKSAANAKTSAARGKIATTRVIQVAIAASPEKSNPKKSMLERRRWLPSTRSSPDVRLLDSEAPATPEIPDVAPINGKESGPGPKVLERSRTMESLAGLARRSWMPSGSRSPSPSPKKAGKDSGRQRTGREWKKARFVTGGPAEPSGRPADSHPGPEGDAGRVTGSPTSTSRALNRASVYFTKFSKRPQGFVKGASSLARSTSSSNTTAGGSADDDTAPSALAITSTPSLLSLGPNTDTLTISDSTLDSFKHRNSSQTTASTATDTSGCASEHASEQTSSQATADTGLTMPHPTSRDPLWASFRKLDTDHAVFAGKPSTTAKMGAIRSALVPFLCNTACHPSNGNREILTPEDVERRATILNKWWNGLLEMLDTGSRSVLAGMRSHSNTAFDTANHMHNLQPVAGVDRPTLLEATTMIMMRPEWRLGTPYFQPLGERSPWETVQPRSDTQSSTAAAADHKNAWAPSAGGAEDDAGMVAESAEHNVRTMFTTNLTNQMALVVDKMSMRHAPTSLVNWSGKACAYAFFFAPGIADILARLWVLRPDLVRRMADEFNLPRRVKVSAEDITALFPPNLHGLGWTSTVKTTTDRLRSAARLPVPAAKIPWHGPWVSRWRGADTDLLFIFCKYYYILVEEFLPSDLPLAEKARAPAFVLLHAQLLANLEGSIQRQGPADGLAAGPLNPADGIYGADASMSALSMPPYNMMRGMAENRLVVLLKNMLAENAVGVLPRVKLAFAEAYMAVAKCATKRTSRYEHTAIFVLCDFLEEVLMTYNYYQNTLNNSYATSPREAETFPLLDPTVSAAVPSKGVDFIDWPFWFDVCRLMLDSNNTMAEIRVLSFVYTVWDDVVTDPARKKALVVDWLLSESTFDRFFNNWCPMVRAYYMRLLCWRICRDSGSANELDEQIFLLAAQRLGTVWAHYLWMKQQSEQGKALRPSTAPCYPTPGKKFMIIRTELQTPQLGLFAGFDQFSTGSSGAAAEGVPYSATPAAPAADAAGAKAESPSKKKWSLIGKVLSMTAGAAAGVGMAGGSMRRTLDSDELDQVRKETAASRTRSPPPPPPPKRISTGPPSSSESTSSTGSSPIFDEVQYHFRFTLTWQNHAAGAGGPPRDRVLTRPRLPALAQARVSARLAAAAASKASNISSAGSSTAGRRSDTPPPLATRGISGAVHSTGLVAEARNAEPLDAAAAAPSTHSRDASTSTGSTELSAAETAISFSESPNLDLAELPIRPARTSFTSDRTSSSSSTTTSSSSSSSSANPSSTRPSEETPTPTTTTTATPDATPLRPTGIYAGNATYAGRALAEWATVAAECNSFVDRRRDEGVLGVGDVEVPTLGVDGLGVSRALAGRA